MHPSKFLGRAISVAPVLSVAEREGQLEAISTALVSRRKEAVDARKSSGIEVRILEILGPHGSTRAECEAYANSQRIRAAVTYRLVDYRQLKYVCVELESPK